MTRKVVDNSADGNCMYYSYGISLMYYLLGKRDKALAEQIFTKLELSDPEKLQLHALLDNTKLTEFTSDQLKKIIEPILGTAARKVAADKTAEHFLDDPKASPLHTATNYGMVYLFRKELEKHAPHLGSLLSSNNFNNPDYTNAEIYKLFPVQANSELGRFAKAHYADVIRAFHAGWNARVDLMYSKKEAEAIKAGTPIKPRADIANDNFYKQQFLEELIEEKTIEFFTSAANKNLKSYVAHLNTNLRWASEETLLLLHRHVTGERTVSIGVDTNGDGLWTQEYDIDLKLEVYENGRAKSGASSASTGIILDNVRGNHWYSWIEPVVVAPHVDPKPTLDIEPEPPGRGEILKISSFDNHLQALQAEAERLAPIDSAASQEAFSLVSRLSLSRSSFLAPDSTLTDMEFSAECERIIDTAPQDNLKNHRSATLILQGLLNALISIANLFVSLANLFGKFEPIQHYQAPSEAGRTDASVSALLTMRARKDMNNQREEQDSPSPTAATPPLNRQ